MSESRCPKCGAEPDGFVSGEGPFSWECGSKRYILGSLKIDQSDQCRIAELTRQLAERDELLRGARPHIDQFYYAGRDAYERICKILDTTVKPAETEQERGT